MKKIPERYSKNTRLHYKKRPSKKFLKLLLIGGHLNDVEKQEGERRQYVYITSVLCQRGETETGRENFRPRAAPRVMLCVLSHDDGEGEEMK